MVKHYLKTFKGFLRANHPAAIGLREEVDLTLLAGVEDHIQVVAVVQEVGVADIN